MKDSTKQAHVTISERVANLRKQDSKPSILIRGTFIPSKGKWRKFASLHRVSRKGGQLIDADGMKLFPKAGESWCKVRPA